MLLHGRTGLQLGLCLTHYHCTFGDAADNFGMDTVTQTDFYRMCLEYMVFVGPYFMRCVTVVYYVFLTQKRFFRSEAEGFRRKDCV